MRVPSRTDLVKSRVLSFSPLAEDIVLDSAIDAPDFFSSCNRTAAGASTASLTARGVLISALLRYATHLNAYVEKNSFHTPIVGA
jgi:hypothetical protein